MNAAMKIGFGLVAATAAVLVVGLVVREDGQMPEPGGKKVSAQRALAAGYTTVRHDGGPVVDGLQLHFEVQSDLDVDGNVHDCSLSIVNVSNEPITFVSDDFPSDKERVDYAETVGSHLGFAIYPEDPPLSYQSCAPSHWAKVRPYTLAPGDDLTVRSVITGRDLTWEGGSRERYTFAADGFYLVRAVLDIKMENGRSTRLWSNEQPYIIGGTYRRPKLPAIRLFDCDEAAGTVSLDAGSDLGVEVGDRYVVYRMLGEGWVLEVTKTRDQTSVARVSRLDRGLRASGTNGSTQESIQHPVRGEMARLMMNLEGR